MVSDGDNIHTSETLSESDWKSKAGIWYFYWVFYWEVDCLFCSSAMVSEGETTQSSYTSDTCRGSMS